MKSIVFVSCVGKKLAEPAPAADLYQSTWFKKARAYAEAHANQWFILSAKHGVVFPEKVIEPYDVTLNAMYVRMREMWAERIYHWIRQNLPIESELTFLAGAKYRLPLVIWLQNAGYTTDAPLARLSIGQQLAWLNRQNKDLNLGSETIFTGGLPC